MRLAVWLKDRGIKQSDAAQALGISAGYLSNLCADPPNFWPGRELMVRIREFTGGAVTADDFLPAREAASGSGAAE